MDKIKKRYKWVQQKYMTKKVKSHKLIYLKMS